MGFLMKFLGGWKLYAIGGAVVAAVSFYAGQRWEKGALHAALEAELAANKAQYEENLAEQDRRWKLEVDGLNEDLAEWAAQAAADTKTIAELIAAQDALRRQFDELDSEITVVTDFGTCSFSDDAVSLLRSASEAAGAATVMSGN